ncbi:hypothetical protein Nos7524_4620 [Nostoc sp. PCC 7524]|nr:hypothetical protein Nos7524_4620 [Nostoc sp. PCC 7524]
MRFILPSASQQIRVYINSMAVVEVWNEKDLPVREHPKINYPELTV